VVAVGEVDVGDVVNFVNGNYAEEKAQISNTKLTSDWRGCLE